MRRNVFVSAALSAVFISNSALAQSSYTALSEAESPNDPEAPTMSLFAMNSFDIYSLIFARSATDREIERFLTPSSPTIEDPWQRREAERDFLTRFNQRVEYLRNTGPRPDEVIIFEYPLIFSHFDFDQQTFRFEVPAAASSPVYLEGEPYALQPEPVIHIAWSWSDTSVVLFEDICSSSSTNSLERVPTNFSRDRLMRENAPNRFGYPPSVRELPRTKYSCMELHVADSTIARTLYSYAVENALFLYGSCLGVLPAERVFQSEVPRFLAGRPSGADAVCVIGSASIGRKSDIPFPTVYHFADWDTSEGAWKVRHSITDAFSDIQ